MNTGMMSDMDLDKMMGRASASNRRINPDDLQLLTDRGVPKSIQNAYQSGALSDKDFNTMLKGLGLFMNKFGRLDGIDSTFDRPPSPGPVRPVASPIPEYKARVAPEPMMDRMTAPAVPAPILRTPSGIPIEDYSINPNPPRGMLTR